MLLAYEYEELLRNPANAEEVVSILRELDTDLVTPEIAERQKVLYKRLRDMGEDRIYKRLKE